MGTAIKHSVPDRVKPSFVISDIRILLCSGMSIRVPGCQKLQWRLNLVWCMMLYSCTRRATVGIKGDLCICFLMPPFSYILHIPYNRHVVAAEVRWLPPSLSQMVTDQRLRIVEHTTYCRELPERSSHTWLRAVDDDRKFMRNAIYKLQLLQVCSESVGKNVWNWTSDICYEHWTGLRAKLVAFKHVDTI